MSICGSIRRNDIRKARCLDSMISDLSYISPDWPAPANVRAFTTTRAGGASLGPYASLNLGDHVGDDPAAVVRNRELLRAALKFPTEPVWLRQVHGTQIIDAVQADAHGEADGAWSAQPGVVCAVLTADCLPVFLCDRAGTKVALLHAGWRGLAAGVIEQGVRALAVVPEDLLVWLGPAIGPQAFEVGMEVKAAFVQNNPAAARAFVPTGDGRYLADLYALARLRLSALGVHHIYGGGFCTFTDRDRFFSYRRDGTCGRMASLIWLE
jgi:YfiH family protein